MQDDRTTEQYVYVIQMGDDGPVKIGISDQPRYRLETLQTGNPMPLRIVTTFSGGRALEQALHRNLRAHRMSGEWFRPHADVWAAIQEEVARPGRTSYSGVTPNHRYDRCSNCDTLLNHGVLGFVRESGEAPSTMCPPCEEFAAMRASGVDPFADEVA